MKRMLSMLLTVLMLFSLLPAQVFAEEMVPVETTSQETEAAETTEETAAAETEEAVVEKTSEAAEEEPAEAIQETLPEVYLEVSDEAVNGVEFDTTGWLWPVKATNAPAGVDNKALYCKNMARAYTDDHQALDITDYTGYTYAIRATKSGTVESVFTGCGNWNGARDGGSSCSSATCDPKLNGNPFYEKAYYNGKSFCGYGNGVVIKHDNIDTKSAYAHLGSVTVSPGEWVEQGHIIGYMGSTGASTGVHLHFRIDHNYGSGYVAVNNNPIGDIPVHGTWNGIDTILYKDECVSQDALLYIAQCDRYPTFGTVLIRRDGANINDRPCSITTDPQMVTLIDATAGQIYTVTAVYKNTQGNYWYEVMTSEQGRGYIFIDNCLYDVSFDDVACTAAVPASVAMDGTLTLTGSITSIGTQIQKAVVTLYKEDGTKYKSLTKESVDNAIDMSAFSFQLSEKKLMKLSCEVVIYVAHYNTDTEKYPVGSYITRNAGTVQLTCVNHTYGNWTLTTPCTCTVNGEWTRSCTICGHKDTKPDEAPGHNWTIFNSSGMTCTNPGYTNYSCLTCGEQKSDNKQVTWSDWTTEYPDTSLDRIETKTQYRYRDLSGGWQGTQTGYVDYVKSWPDGFDHNNSYRTTTFAQSPRTAYENTTERLTIVSDDVVGYLYWHWCRGQQLGLNYNRSISSAYTDTYWCFHSYYTTTYVEYDGNANAWSAGNYDCCQDSYWYFQLPVYRQTYQIESKTGAAGEWGSWSSWSDTAVSESSTRQVQTRNLYRYINSGLADHRWGNPVRTKEPTETTEGELTYTCLVCGNKKIEFLPKLEFPECVHSNTTLQGKVDPTCKEAGYSGDTICSDCGDTVEQGKALVPTGHTEVTVKGEEATCTKAGKTDGKKCTVCGTVTVAQKTIKAKGHTEVTVKGKAATCTETGLTDGKKCSVCDTVTVEQTVIGIKDHTYTSDKDIDCNVCGAVREEEIVSVPMHRMYDPNSGEHFYTGSEVERDFLVTAGWSYEGVGFNFPKEGKPVYRLYDPVYGEHLYTMDEAEKAKLISWGWNDEGVAFNSAGTDEVPQYRLHNPNAKRGGYHFTGSIEERDFLISIGWINEGIGWYSCLE